MGRCIVVTEQYQVTIQSQMGPRKGVLTLRYRGDRVTGSLEMVGYVNTVQGVRTEDGTIHLVHPIRTVISTIPCETDLELHGGCCTLSDPRAPRGVIPSPRDSHAPCLSHSEL